MSDELNDPTVLDSLLVTACHQAVASIRMHVSMLKAHVAEWEPAPYEPTPIVIRRPAPEPLILPRVAPKRWWQ